MKIKSLVQLSVWAALFFLLLSGKSLLLGQGLFKYLPGSGEVKSWNRDGNAQLFKGEDLYLHINGGAVIYHEYGFSQVVVQEYKSQEGKSISVEIFEMESPEAAFGIYTFKSSSRGKELPLGNEGRLEDYYLNFWKGNILVTLTGYDQDEVTLKGLKEIAQVIDSKIEMRGERPSLVHLLPKKNLIQMGMKYFKGHLGLYNIYPFFAKDIFAQREGVKGDYKNEYSILILNYNDRQEASHRFEEVKKRFKESSKYKDFRPFDENFKIIDDKDKAIFLKTFSRYIIIILGTLGESQAQKIFSSLQNKIKETSPR